MNLNSRKGIIARLRRGKSARHRFLESHLSKTTAFQIRAMRDALGWSQDKLGGKVGMNQNAISRLESPNYGKATLTTLKRLAATFDVCLIVRFVPFSEMVDWVSGTPRLNKGLTSASLAVPSFEIEESLGIFDDKRDGVLLPVAVAEPKSLDEQLTDFYTRGQRRESSHDFRKKPTGASAQVGEPKYHGEHTETRPIEPDFRPVLAEPLRQAQVAGQPR